MLALHVHRPHDGSEYILWLARLWSIAVLLIVIGFIIGEGILLDGLAEWIGFLLFPVGICLGMVLAWRYELLGSLITIFSLALFYALYFATGGDFPRGWAWLAFAFPGFLFFLHWEVNHHSRLHNHQFFRH